MDHQGAFDLVAYYDTYPQVEEPFQAALEESLQPRGPELLYDLVRKLDLPAGSRVIDVGCGEGGHSLRLAERFGFNVRGVDPVQRHIDIAGEKLRAAATTRPELRQQVSFTLDTAEQVPADNASTDLIWCRDVLVHITDLNAAYGEFHRILCPGGHALVYQMFGTDRLEPREAQWLFTTMGVVPSSADPYRTEQAITAAGLRIDERLELGTEWGEYAQETRGTPGRKLLHAARLLRHPQQYTTRYGKPAYDIMLGDCLWHVYRMIGKLSPRIYLISRPD